MASIEVLEGLKDKTPVEVRREFRKGSHFMLPSSGFCKGFKQANFMAVHKNVADDLVEYCRLNYGPLAKLFSSKPGQFGVPGLSTDSDVRTDIAAYSVFINGEFREFVPDLLKFGDQLNDFCFFYFGCSYSFDEALLAGGVPLRNLEQEPASTVPMYTTNVPCHPYGVFHAMEAVSLRPIPRDLVERSFQITHPMPDVHGAPMHIGDPAVIGIDIDKIDHGDPIVFKEGDIPVFWPCGVTGLETIKVAKLPLSFYQKPGCLLLLDAPMDKHVYVNPPPEDLPRVVWLADNPPLASVLSQATMDKIKKLEEAAVEDLGKRQIGNLLVEDDLLKSALSLSHAETVAITTGFPLELEGDNLYESDGPPGAVAIATTLQALGKEVVLVVDDEGGLVDLMRNVIRLLLEKGVISQPIPVECYPPKGQAATAESASSFLTREDGQTPRFDHLVAIERGGRAQDGHYYSANGTDKTSRIGNVDMLFEVASGMRHVFTTGIGDGGNEIGMGKVKEKTATHIPNGDKIACSVATDYLICAGVSNWGGYSLAVALALLRLCPIHDRYRRRAVGLPPSQEEVLAIIASSPTVAKEEKVLQTLVDLGFMDASRKVKMAVDWMPFHDVHAKKIQEIADILISTK